MTTLVNNGDRCSQPDAGLIFCLNGRISFIRPGGTPGICGTKGDNKLSKGKFLNIIFLIVEVIAFIRLTIEVFGDMNPDVLTISAVIFGIGLAGNCIFTIVGAIREMKKK